MWLLRCALLERPVYKCMLNHVSCLVCCLCASLRVSPCGGFTKETHTETEREREKVQSNRIDYLYYCFAPTDLATCSFSLLFSLAVGHQGGSDALPPTLYMCLCVCVCVCLIALRFPSPLLYLYLGYTKAKETHRNKEKVFTSHFLILVEATHVSPQSLTLSLSTHLAKVEREGWKGGEKCRLQNESVTSLLSRKKSRGCLYF